MTLNEILQDVQDKKMSVHASEPMIKAMFASKETNFTLQAVVARIDGIPVSIEGINDSYTPVQMIVPKEKLNDEALEFLRSVPWIYESDTAFNLGEDEAKDQHKEIGNLKVSMETIEVKVDFEKEAKDEN